MSRHRIEKEALPWDYMTVERWEAINRGIK
jgi:hypothetical protein